MPTAPVPVQLDVDGGTLHAQRWGTGERVVVALHGITANAASWGAVAERLPPSWSVVAPDQRGRGRSRGLPGPFGVDQLARDALRVVEATGAEVLAGHSLGAYVALAAAHEHPGAVARLVLVDGGLPLPVPSGLSAADVDALLDAAVGPMMDRLGVRHRDEDAYVDLFRAHPAMGPYWNEHLEAYARYDAVADPDGGVRAAASVPAVRAAGRELITRTDDVRRALDELQTPTDLLVAPRGMDDEPQGFLPTPVVEAAARGSSVLTVTSVPDSNHYTVLLGDRGAGAVARAVAHDDRR